MINQPKSWTINDKNLANTYLNIANVLLVVKNYMKSHMDNVKNGEGIITIGDIDEALKFLEEQINNRLRSSVSNKVKITLSVPTDTEGNTSTNSTSALPESISRKRKKSLTESQLRRIIKESVRNVLNETRMQFYRCEGHNSKNRKKAMEELSWASKIVPVVGGYIGFETWDDYYIWKNQK